MPKTNQAPFAGSTGACADTFELRVLDGELRGARSVMNAAKPVNVGGDIGCDVVLRSADLEGCGIAFRAVDGDLRVLVLRGQARAQGSLLPQGEEVSLPLYTPLRLGRITIAIGEPGASAWTALLEAGLDDHEAAESQPESESDTPHATVDEDAPVAAGIAARPPVRWSRWLVMSGSSLTALSISVFAFAYTAKPTTPSHEQPLEQQVKGAEVALQSAGFGWLAVGAGEGRELRVSGYLDTSAQRARLEQVLAGQAVPCRLDVVVTEQLADAVQEVFRVNNVAAEVEPFGQGGVFVKTRVADAASLDLIAANARRDVPGLAMLDLRNTPPARVPDPVPVIDDPGKRVASIVPGDAAYVVTADGTHYFEGAMLPTGHRIASIREREVMLERNGETTPLRF